MWPDERPVRNFAHAPNHGNVPMWVAGMIITGLGVLSLPVSIGMMIPRAMGNAGSCSFCSAWYTLLPAGMIIPPAIGIPLWVNGGKSPGAWEASMAPTVAPGLGSVSLHWSF
jgi:hypothetical protein